LEAIEAGRFTVDPISIHYSKPGAKPECKSTDFTGVRPVLSALRKASCKSFNLIAVLQIPQGSITNHLPPRAFAKGNRLPTMFLYRMGTRAVYIR
jgi:hypothetical protein